jgi:hypothetical protein
MIPNGPGKEKEGGGKPEVGTLVIVVTGLPKSIHHLLEHRFLLRGMVLH